MGQLAVGYVRVSTEEQAVEGVSLAAQEERIRAYCTLNGLNLTDVLVDEGVSAGKPLSTRPEGARLLAALKGKNKATHVVDSVGGGGVFAGSHPRALCLCLYSETELVEIPTAKSLSACYG